MAKVKQQTQSEKILRGLAFVPFHKVRKTKNGKTYYFFPSICYEILFPNQIRDVYQKNKNQPPALLISLADDQWFVGTNVPYLILNQSRWRAVEAGIYLIRLSNTGLSSVINNRGKVIYQSPPYKKMSFVNTLPLKHKDASFYIQYGDTITIIIISTITLFFILIFFRLTGKSNRSLFHDYKKS